MSNVVNILSTIVISITIKQFADHAEENSKLRESNTCIFLNLA